MMDLKPLAGASALASSVGAVLHFGMGNLDSLLAIAGPLAYRIAPRVPWLPADALNRLVFVLSVLFVLYGLGRLGRRAFDRFA